MKLFVGSLPFDTDDQALRQLFSQFGSIRSTKVIHDRETGKSRGFGFVEFDNSEAAKQALTLDGSQYSGRYLNVKEAEDRRPVIGAPRASNSPSGPQVTYKGRPSEQQPRQDFSKKSKPKRQGGGGKRRRGNDWDNHDDAW